MAQLNMESYRCNDVCEIDGIQLKNNRKEQTKWTSWFFSLEFDVKIKCHEWFDKIKWRSIQLNVFYYLEIRPTMVLDRLISLTQNLKHHLEVCGFVFSLVYDTRKKLTAREKKYMIFMYTSKCALTFCGCQNFWLKISHFIWKLHIILSRHFKLKINEWTFWNSKTRPQKIWEIVWHKLNAIDRVTRCYTIIELAILLLNPT